MLKLGKFTHGRWMMKRGYLVTVVSCIFTALGTLATIYFGVFSASGNAVPRPSSEPQQVVVNIQPQQIQAPQIQPQSQIEPQPQVQTQPIAVADSAPPTVDDSVPINKSRRSTKRRTYDGASYYAPSEGNNGTSQRYRSRQVATDTAESLAEKVISRESRIEVCIARNNTLGDAQIDIVQKKNCVEDIISAINYLEMNAHEIRQLAGGNPKLDEALNYVRYKRQYHDELNKLNLILRGMARP